MTLSVLTLWAPAGQASAPLAVSSTTTVTAFANMSTPLDGLSVTNPDDQESLEVTVSTDVGTLAITTTDNLALAFGNNWSGDASITFSGTVADLNSALASTSLTTGSDAGSTAHIAITALPTAPGFVYSPTNGHFYEFVPDEGITQPDAVVDAANRSFQGQTGYLASIPSRAINDLVSNRLEGAVNVWFGAESVDTPGEAVQRTWQWMYGPLAGDPISYCSNYTDVCDFVDNDGLFSSWNSSEPNNSGADDETPHSGEWVAVTNYSNEIGIWNDFPPDIGQQASGYVVEYGDLTDGATSFSGLVSDSSSVSILAVPDAPSDLAAIGGNGQATVTFGAPDDNGSPITGYTIQITDGVDTTTQVCDASPCLLSGLDNGTQYTIWVHANSDNGPGAWTDPVTVTPATRPGPPTDVTASRGPGSAILTFTAPADDGGADVTSYTVTSEPGELTATCSASPCTITGLTNGTVYTFTMHATNRVDDSTETEASNEVTPAAVPDAPEVVTATHGNETITVDFDVPSGNGDPITSYLVSAAFNGVAATATCSGSPCTISGLTNGTQYDVTVTAVNSVGAGAPSVPVHATPATVPDAPGTVTVDRGANQVTVSFDEPVSDGGAAISAYEYSLDAGETWLALETQGSEPVTATITGLSNGTPYTVSVRARNAEGPGELTTSGDPVTPAQVPDAPTNVVGTRGDGEVTLTFSTPADNGSPITGYSITIFDGLANVGSLTCAESPCEVDVLTNGRAYTFRVVAVNDVGESDASAASDPATPAAAPDAPTGVGSVSQDSATVLRWNAPGNAGGLPITGYEYTSDGGETWHGLTAAGDDPYTATVSGLTNGRLYVIWLRATNAVGGGTASQATSVTPATVPGAPRAVTVTGGGTAAVVTWDAPASDGGSPVVGYTLTTSPGGATCTTTARTCTITGLVPGETYRFSIVADNTNEGWSGTGVGAAAESAPATATATPGVPTRLSGVGGDRTLTLAWTPPLSVGASALTGYAVSIDNGRTWTSPRTSGTTRLSTTLVGVRKTVTYPVRVRAVNADGLGVISPRLDVRIPQWFSDPVGPATRADEVAVPRHPKRYDGKLRHTVATARARDGSPAFPGASLRGRQLQSGEAVSLSSGSMFKFNKTKLLPAGRRALQATVASLTYVQAVTCEGYADYGGRAGWERTLSKKRAKVVCSALRAYGADVVTRRVSFGSTRPVVIGGSRAGRAANRRVVIDITRG